MNSQHYAIFATIITIGLGGCSAQLGDSGESTSELAAALGSGASGAASGQNTGYFHIGPKAFYAKIREFLEPTSFALGACPLYPSGGTCSGTSMTLTYLDCYFGTSSATWNGGQALSFGGGATCGTTSLPITTNGQTLTRTFTGQGMNATTRTSSNGVVVQLDTTTVTGYSTSVSGGFLITGNGTGHTIHILGINLASTGRFNMTASTTSNLVVANPGPNRTIQSGTILMQHNIARFTASSVFSSVTFSAAGGCFPQSGTITTTFTGGTRSGTETLTFNGGTNATLTPSSGSPQSVTLTHCF